MLDKIITTISAVLQTAVDETTTQKNCDKWDSLMHIHLIIALESVFNVSFEPEEITQMTNIPAIQQTIQTKLLPDALHPDRDASLGR